MPDLLTTKDVQALLQVDRSTIYRMAEAGKLPAVKVGKQWRFPADLVHSWLETRTNGPVPLPTQQAASVGDALPLEWIQLLQDGFADTLDVMLVVTDLEGVPITEPSHPGPFYELMTRSDPGHRVCQEQWRELGQMLALEPRFVPTIAGLLCARAFIRIGSRLAAMVIAFAVAPEDWTPTTGDAAEVADRIGASTEDVRDALGAIPRLGATEQTTTLAAISRMAELLGLVGNDRATLLGRLARIGELSHL
jgi:excisionase family DNA binding protein